MIYLLYVIVAAGVVWLSIKASQYVDLLDKKTKLSGAFIGGIMLSAVTSLPELFTSLSSTVLLGKPELCIGNILGSNLFNIAILSILVIISIKNFSKAKVAKGHYVVTFSVFAVYIAIILNKYNANIFGTTNIFNIDIFTFSITSIIIVILYCFTVKKMSEENGALPEQAVIKEEPSKTDCLTVKQIVIRFILVSLGIVILSIIITYITDIIAQRHNLGAGIAGAIFLGVATSLPEVSSTIALFKIKNYNIAIGNIVGSNIFNFLILAIVDLIYIGGSIYTFGDVQTLNLL
ncbi:MAG: cation transporter, partial [Oscillospiraceae bacterium]